MYIKSIVLDGFKSYGNRVEITGFDPEFNAITGLNGTGKSNILDSICFVLGITNLSNVRAGSLQELIYKHGQAGITKATVSITFDNRDKDQCPMGYENHNEITVTRQVVMGGKNKYLINGVNVQNKRVSDLFCSVQLNVNNPHFLIMQGRITKVLNMKPPEILSMVEEAAGTRMYETKKQAAQKTIEKKDAKLLELDDIIKEDIAPKLQRLQDERSQFQEYQKVVRELENVTRLHVAWRYFNAEKSAEEATGKVAQVQENIESKKREIEEKRADAKRLGKEIGEMKKKIDKESGGVVKELEERLQAAEDVELSAAAEMRAAKDALLTHQKRMRLMQRAVADDERALAAAAERLQRADAQFADQRAASAASEAALEEAQRRFLAVSSGLEDEGEGGSLRAQLMSAQQQAAAAATSLACAAMEREHSARRLQELERQFAARGAQFEKDQRAVDGKRAELQALETQLAREASQGRDPDELQTQLRALQSSVRSQRDAMQRSGAQLARCDFRYSPPTPDFDASRVSGTVCKLIKVKDPKYCMALETAAGGKLYNVVVDTEVTSKLLLQRGNLQTRTTIIPLNKIIANVIPRDVVAQAQRVGGGPENVQLASDLLQFDARVRSAAEWVWGGTLVCADLDTARRVCFHPRVRRRCVTLEGDLFDPAGTLTGGAPAPGGSVLLALRKRAEDEAALQSDERRLRELADELETARHAADAAAVLQRKRDALHAELEVAEARMAATASAQQHAEIESLRARLAELDEAAMRDELTKRTATEKVERLQLQVADLEGHREREFKKAEEALKKAKRDVELHGSWKQHEQEFETLKLEVAELEKAVANGRSQLQEAETVTEDLQRAQRDAEEALAGAAEGAKKAQALVKKQKAELASKSDELQRLTEAEEQLASAEANAQLQLKELELTAQRLAEEAGACGERTRALEREHPWLQEERAYFGLQGGAFDWEARGAQQAAARVAQLRESKERLARGLNARAHALLGQEEEQYQDALRKKSKVEADKAALVKVMLELDEKKRTALLAACERVNADFASIFGSLLPGAMARLRPPPGASVLDGLEVGVGFNGVWKESLSELSGGQRSLVALSLVLAMLLFKPAPLYVLDEVDAALDLSHTQNIGRMLRTHFRRSQFIVVSLKDGMFNNANVLFRTRFEDGMSAVQRTTNSNLNPN